MVSRLMGLKRQINRHPSSNCKQRLSPEELERRTQSYRVKRHLMRINNGEANK